MGSLVASTSTATAASATTNPADHGFDWEALLDPSRDSHIFCNDRPSYETQSWQTLPECLDFGLYKHDPCQPNQEWEDIPIFESSTGQRRRQDKGQEGYQTDEKSS